MNKDLRNYIENKKKTPERIVFGYAIGEDYPNKTAADALRENLYDKIREIDHATPSTKEETEKKLNHFLETWDQDPALTEEEKKTILGVALVDAKQKRSKFLLDAEKHKKTLKEWNLVKEGVIPEEKYTSNVESEMSARYNEVITLLKRMIEKQKNNDNVM